MAILLGGENLQASEIIWYNVLQSLPWLSVGEKMRWLRWQLPKSTQDTESRGLPGFPPKCALEFVKFAEMVDVSVVQKLSMASFVARASNLVPWMSPKLAHLLETVHSANGQSMKWENSQKLFHAVIQVILGNKLPTAPPTVAEKQVGSGNDGNRTLWGSRR